ncbi:MAG: hypothetical protein HPM95_09095 [Alphaproteobacteria bacterium]|nr:hypothetical protein [Alphaproteobacteria bacterium]
MDDRREITINRRRFDRDDGVEPTMTTDALAELAGIPAQNAIVERETGPRTYEALERAQHFPCARACIPRDPQVRHGRLARRIRTEARMHPRDEIARTLLRLGKTEFDMLSADALPGSWAHDWTATLAVTRAQDASVWTLRLLHLDRLTRQRGPSRNPHTGNRQRRRLSRRPRRVERCGG